MCVFCEILTSIFVVKAQDVEKQQEQAQTDEQRHSAAEQESVTAMIVY